MITKQALTKRCNEIRSALNVAGSAVNMVAQAENPSINQLDAAEILLGDATQGIHRLKAVLQASPESPPDPQ